MAVKSKTVASKVKPVAQAARTTVPVAARNDEWENAKRHMRIAVGKTDDVSWKRVISAHLCAMFSAVGIGWLSGIALEYLVLASLVASPSGWLAFAVFIVGYLMAFVMAFLMHRFTYAYVISKRADQHVSSLIARIRTYIPTFGDEVAHA